MAAEILPSQLYGTVPGATEKERPAQIAAHLATALRTAL